MDKSGSDTTVKVAVRIRPQLASERIEMCQTCTTVSACSTQIILGKDKAFTFDYVYDVDSQQDFIYSNCASDLIDGTFDGLNATILAYGQTGSGKTYTMGTSFDVTMESDRIGIIPRAVEHLFRGIDERRKNAIEAGRPPPEFKINAQFMELYNEEIFDLLDTSRDPADKNHKSHIRIHEDAHGSIYTVGLAMRPVNTVNDTLECLKTGALSRTTASTNMNTQSSRSHAVFTLHIRQQRIFNAQPISDVSVESGVGGGREEQQLDELEMLTAKFNFVDLAGSERLKRTGATGERAREGISINCGLLALGNVISALGDAEKIGCHVPYRDSKLTRLLQDSLGGNSRTKMIACISPSDRDFLETLNTLKYANRARNIRNVVVVNQDLSSRQMASLRAEIQALQIELTDYRLGKRVADGEATSDLVKENAMLQADNNNLRDKVKSLHDTVDTVTSRNAALEAEKDLLQLAVSVAGGVNLNEEVKRLLAENAIKCETLQSKLMETECLLEVMSLGRGGVSSRSAGSMVGGVSSVLRSVSQTCDPDEHVQRLLLEAKNDLSVQMKSSRKSGTSFSSMGDQNEIESDEPAGDIEAEGYDNDDDEAMPSDSDSENEREKIATETLHENLSDLTCEISIKQKLIEELEQSQRRLRAMRAAYEEKLGALEIKIKQTELERDKVLANLDGAGGVGLQRDSEKAKKLREDYDKKLSAMQSEMKKLEGAKREHARLMRSQTHYETQLKTLQSDLGELKKMKVKLMRQLQEEATKSRETELRCRKEVVQLKKQERLKDNRIQTLETEKKRKEIVLKRKLEEVEALRRQQKKNMSAKAAGRLEKSIPSRSPTDILMSKSSEKADEQFDTRLFKSSWDNLEKLVNSVVVKRQTLAHLDRDMEIWIKQRELVSRKLEKLLRRRERRISSSDDVVPNDEMSKLNYEIEALRESVVFIQENINECQNCIVHFEEIRQEDEVDPSQIFVHSTLTEAMYLLDRCTNLAINKGVLAAQKDDECRELVAKLHQQQMDAIFQRDMLQSLIQDKVDVQVDNNLVMTSITDDDREAESFFSSSPVDSLENEFRPIHCNQRSNGGATMASEQLRQDGTCSFEAGRVIDTSNEVGEVGEYSAPKTSGGDDIAMPSIMSSSQTTAQNLTLAKKQPKPPHSLVASPIGNRKTMSRPTPSPCRVTVPRTASSTATSMSALAPAAGPVTCQPKASCQFVNLQTLSGHTKAVLSVCATATNLYSSAKDRTAKLWDLVTCRQILSLDGHPNNVVTVRHCVTTGLVYTASAYIVKVWDPRRGNICINTLTSAGLLIGSDIATVDDVQGPVSCPPGETTINDIAITGSMLYTAGGNTVRLWDIKMLRPVGKLYGGNQAAVLALAVSSNNSVYTSVVTGSKDRCIKVFQVPFDCAGGVLNPRCSLEPSHADSVQSLCVIAGGGGVVGDVLYTGARDMCIKKWDLSEGQLRQSIKNAHRDWVCGLSAAPCDWSTASLGFVPLPVLLLSVCRAGVLKSWSVISSSFVNEIQAHTSAINALCVNNSIAFTAANDKTIKLWTLGICGENNVSSGK